MAAISWLRRLLGTSAQGSAHRTTRLVLEALEDRTLPVITLTPVPVNAVELTNFNGPVATFTDSDPADGSTDFTAAVDWGDGVLIPAVVTGGNGNFTITGSHSFPDEATSNVNVFLTQISPIGNFNVSTQATVTEGDVLKAGGTNITTVEGTSFNGQVATFTNSALTPQAASDFQATIDWGDGTKTAGVVSQAETVYIVSGTHTYADEGVFATTVVLTDDAPGTATATAKSTATVAESDTLVGTGAAIAPDLRVAFNGSVGTFTDTNLATPAADFSATINWGDGTQTTTGTVTGAAGAFTVSGTHMYNAPGNYPVIATLTDVDDDGSGSATAKATANSTATVLFTVTTLAFAPTEASAFNGPVASIVTTDATISAGDFLVTIDWGDGTQTNGDVTGNTGGPFTVAGNHTYAEEGSYNGVITVQLVERGSITDNVKIVVADPSVIWTSQSTYRTRESLDFGVQQLATFIDPAGAEPVGDYSATIDWGDGVTTAGTVVAPGEGGSIFAVNGQHTYAESGHYAVRVTAHHDAAADTTIVTDALVVDAPVLVNTFAGPQAIAAGQWFVGLMGTFTDDNPHATTSDFFTGIYWGDGGFNYGEVVFLGLDPAGKSLFGIYGYHAYSSPGVFTYTLTDYDVDGSICIATSPTVVVFARSQFLDLYAYSLAAQTAQVSYQTYSSEFAQMGLPYQQTLANYWLAVYQASIAAYQHEASLPPF